MIREYQARDREQVITLWKEVLNYTQAHNSPREALDRKLKEKDHFLWVSVEGDQVVGTIMAGYDGHRGWIYSLAVDPEARGKGLGSELVHHAESALEKAGCPKINLQVMPDNRGVVEFYRKLGYAVEERISMGKKLIR